MLTTTTVEQLLGPKSTNAIRGSVRMDGHSLLVEATAFADEIERREHAGLGALEDRELLQAMFELPLGIPTWIEKLDPCHRNLIEHAPAGAVDFTWGGDVTRLAVPPIRASTVLLRSRDWETGITAASQYAPFCARAVIFPAGLRELDLAVMEGRYYGVGVAAEDRSGSAHWVVEPANYRQWHDPARWRFDEQLWGRLLHADQLG
ncbi:hypothetical protein BIV57_07995 [Mangrovactinospora gilvigrisea]|uniref:Uncharacterized protein n=1 Tax=Mangrovactinospora gilvigrisea TaxID=1428644 RepID=A0A1J7C900_9ACTN|nr:hypothetical protein [Mangrovactinospora gilvigrisea]OIV38008.1 hypothetical protein BIV57_07995 [Mangrovactinospora gilvigrisea]